MRAHKRTRKAHPVGVQNKHRAPENYPPSDSQDISPSVPAGARELPGDRDAHGDIDDRRKRRVLTALVVLLACLFFPILYGGYCGNFGAESVPCLYGGWCAPDLVCRPLHGLAALQAAIANVSSSIFAPSDAVVALSSSTKQLRSQIELLAAKRNQKHFLKFSNRLLQLVDEGTTLQGSVRDGRSKLLSSAHQVDTALRDMEDFYDVLQQLMASDAGNRCAFVNVSDPQNAVLESKRQKALESTLHAQLLWSKTRETFFQIRQDIVSHRLSVDSTHKEWSDSVVVKVHNSIHVAEHLSLVDTGIDIAREAPGVGIISLLGGAAGSVVGCVVGAVFGGVGCAPGAVAGAKVGAAALGVAAGVEKTVEAVAESHHTRKDVTVLRDIEGVDLSVKLLEYDAHLSRMEGSIGILINYLQLQSDHLRSVHNATVSTDLFTRVLVGDLVAKVHSVRNFTGRVVEQMTLTQESADKLRAD